MSNQDLVNQMYATFLTRAPDAAGNSNWLSQLASGMSPSQLAQSFMMSGEAGNKAQTHGVVLPRSDAQTSQQDLARSVAENTNFMPGVMNPGALTNSTQQNRDYLYPPVMQPGGVQQFNIGGKNVGPDLAKQGIDASALSGLATQDGLANYVAQKLNISLDQAKGIVQQLIPAVGGAAGTMAPMDTGTKPFDPSGMTSSYVSQADG